MRHIVYRPADRPVVEVEVDGSWHYGEIRMWTQDDNGAWSCDVTWSRAPART